MVAVPSGRAEPEPSRLGGSPKKLYGGLAGEAGYGGGDGGAVEDAPASGAVGVGDGLDDAEGGERVEFRPAEFAGGVEGEEVVFRHTVGEFGRELALVVHAVEVGENFGDQIPGDGDQIFGHQGTPERGLWAAIIDGEVAGMMPGAGRGVFARMSRMYRFVGPGLIDVQHQPAVASDKVEYNPLFGYERLLHAAPSGLDTFSQRWTEPVTCPAAARRWSRRHSMEREMVPMPVIVMTWLLILAASMAGLAWMQWPSGNSDGSIEERYDSSIYENLDPSFSKAAHERPADKRRQKKSRIRRGFHVQPADGSQHLHRRG